MKYLVSAFLLCVSMLSLSGQTAQKNIYFSVDSFRLNAENVDLVQKTFDAMNAGDKATFRVLIHDDAKNKGLINELDRKRSAELFDFFYLEGVPAANLKVIKTPGREAKGFISDDMKNLLIYDVEVYKALPAVAFATLPTLRLPEEQPQLFRFQANEEKTIQGSSGTSVTFPARVFEYKTGVSVTGEIQLELSEFLTPAAMASEGLITQSDAKSLQVAGVIHLRATSNGKEVRLHKGKQLSVHFSSARPLTGPKLFTGNFSDGILNLHAVEPPDMAQPAAAGYSLTAPWMHWLACAAPETAEGKGTLDLKVTVSYPVTARLVIPETGNVYVPLLSTDSKDLIFNGLPLNKKASLVVFGEKDGKVFYSSEELTTAAEGKEKIALKEGSLDALEKTLQHTGN